VEGAVHAVENEVISLASEARASHAFSLQESVQHTLQQYITNLDGQSPSNLYELVLKEVEKPLLEMVLKFTGDNQSKAAIILGISRGTLRKKMAIYGLN